MAGSWDGLRRESAAGDTRGSQFSQPWGAACRSHSKPRERWVLEGGLAGLLRGSGLGEQLVQALAQALASPQAGASLATTTCHPILFDAMAEPGAAS